MVLAMKYANHVGKSWRVGKQADPPFLFLLTVVIVYVNYFSRVTVLIHKKNPKLFVDSKTANIKH